MRLGSYNCRILAHTLAYQTYGKADISERHRHRYEVNNHYRELLEKSGLSFSGVNKELNLVEMIEIKNHPWFLACQFHPEFKSKPFLPHPIFAGFIRAALRYQLPKAKPRTDKMASKVKTVKKLTPTDSRFLR